jgi:hypothetical protein
MNGFIHRPVPDTQCWITPFAVKEGQYAYATINGRKRRLHGALYGLIVGAVPDGLELDHLCRNTRCVNPWHLEPITHQENVLRGASGVLQIRRDRCRKGHLYDETNTYQSTNGRVCRKCQNESQRRYRARKEAAC